MTTPPWCREKVMVYYYDGITAADVSSTFDTKY